MSNEQEQRIEYKFEIQDPYMTAYEKVIMEFERRMREREMEGIEAALKEHGFVKERTCKPIDEYSCGVPSCGNCGVTLNMVTSGVRPFNKVLPNYCYNCGAKVVE